MTTTMNWATALTTDYVKSLDEAKTSAKPIKYVLSSDGNVFEMRSTELGDFMVKTNTVIGVDKVEEGFSLNIPKIPFKLLLEAISFFRDVCDQFSNDEAMLQYWFNKETGEFFAKCLPQTTNKVHVTFLRDESLESNPNMILVMDIHSHNNMSAFFSGTDDASEQETRTYGVVGELDKEIPVCRFRYSVEGQFKEVTIDQLFEMPTMKFNIAGYETEREMKPAELFFPQIDFPQEWLDIVEEGKKSQARFFGKGNHPKGRSSFGGANLGNPRGFNLPKNRSINGPLFDMDNSDPFAAIDQMTIFDKDNFSFNKSFGHIHTKMSSPSQDEVHISARLLSEHLTEVNVTDLRVGAVRQLIEPFSMFEIRMLISSLTQRGYGERIKEVLVEYERQGKVVFELDEDMDRMDLDMLFEEADEHICTVANLLEETDDSDLRILAVMIAIASFSEEQIDRVIYEMILEGHAYDIAEQLKQEPTI